jgi:hypothetical protein
LRLTDDILVKLLSIRDELALITVLATSFKEKGFIEDLDERVRANRILPFIKRELARFGLMDLLPEHVRRGWKEAEENMVRKNLALLSEMERIVQSLAREGVRVVLLEGASLMINTYRSAAVRPLYDLELLVSEEDMPCARRIVSLLGYGPCTPKERHSHSVPGRSLFRRKWLDLELCLELRYRLQWPLAMMDTGRALERAVPRAFKDGNLSHLKTEDLVLSLAVQWATHRKGREALLWLIDFRELYERDVVFFDTLAATARAWGLDLCLYLFLEESARLLNTPPVSALAPELVPRGVEAILLKKFDKSRALPSLLAMRPWRQLFAPPGAVAALSGKNHLPFLVYLKELGRLQWQTLAECSRWLSQ